MEPNDLPIVCIPLGLPDEERLETISDALREALCV